MTYFHRTWAQIDLDAVVHNLGALRKRLNPQTRTMAVVKADAYGHGDGATARTLIEAGTDWLAVSNISEGLSLRAKKLDAPILILGYTPPEAVLLLEKEHLTQAIFSMEYAVSLSEAVQQNGATVDCHIKIDSGMSRIGFYAQHGHEAQAAQEIAHACALPGLAASGVFTHFAVADEPNAESDAFTRAQFDCFCKTVELARERGAALPLRHCCNSAASWRFPEMQLEMVRLGIVLYGLLPSREMQPLCGANLRPAMSIYSVVSQCKTLEQGDQISYGRQYSVPEGGRRIATVPVGYADGFRRSFANRARAIVGGRYAPVVGRVCMDQIMIDVTGIPDVKQGDRVTLIGAEGDAALSLDEWAVLNGSINYEEACLIGRRVPRVYFSGGKELAVTDYLAHI